MGVDQQVRELAERTPNFGYLLGHEPLLVAYGATAEASLFADPNIAMIKCRQFGEVLTARAFIQFGIPNMPQKQYQRLKVLSDQGFLTKRVHGWFNDVREIGNRAVHEGYAAQRDAELVEMKTQIDEQTAAAAAEATARAAANQEILRAVQAQAGMHQLIQQLSTKVDDLQRQLSARASAAVPIGDTTARS